MNRRKVLKGLVAATFVPTLRLEASDSKAFTFQYSGKGALPPSQPLTVSVLDADTMQPVSDTVQATVQVFVNWLTVAPGTGLTVLHSQVSLTNAAKSLDPGTYKTVITVAAPDPVVNSPVLASVTLIVVKGKK
jgi:hypothetical protein